VFAVRPVSNPIQSILIGRINDVACKHMKSSLQGKANDDQLPLCDTLISKTIKNH
jgi:hypothetical protein